MTAIKEMPVGWAYAKLGDLVQVLRGITYDKSVARDSGGPGLIPILRATNIGQHLDFEDLVFVPESCVSEEQRLRPGDIVVAASSGSRSVVGKAAPLSIAWTGSFGAFCVAVRPSELVNPRYIAFFLTTSEYRERVSTLAAGVNINNLKREHILSTPINLAPRNEQDRIVAELEKQFTQLEAGVEAVKRVQAQIKRYRSAVLKAACEGRLVPTEADLARREKRDYEPADKLLARILKERRARWEGDQLAKMKAVGKPPKDDRWKAKYVEPLMPLTGGLPSLPEGWMWASLDQLTSVVTSGSRGWADHYSDSGPLFIRAQDIKTDTLQLEAVARVNPPANAEGTRTRVTSGDLLITITGANVTKSALVPNSIPEGYVSQHVGLARPIETGIGAFLFTWIVSPAHGRHYLEKCAYGAGKPGLNLEQLRELTVALPPLKEQQRIVMEVESRMSLANSCDASVKTNLSRAARLRQAILHKAFAGGLVPQIPADEPASKLLEHISAEEGAKPVSKQGRYKTTTAVPKMKATR
ncbi:restriction endonuclease subunit S [Corallococcus exercitus]|uniref:Type I restriction modification DNA specificity domain-containing protein n=1 Tax=Corallococcus exercitus TaxID=2316736 RepID=A0A7Y4K067_9BACT|nr:restriction endonuclease subunit S [Corallococcus exercitus]NOK14294.1 hypothetical protein [Corallococcus exercitus]